MCQELAADSTWSGNAREGSCSKSFCLHGGSQIEMLECVHSRADKIRKMLEAMTVQCTPFTQDISILAEVVFGCVGTQLRPPGPATA